MMARMRRPDAVLRLDYVPVLAVYDGAGAFLGEFSGDKRDVEAILARARGEDEDRDDAQGEAGAAAPGDNVQEYGAREELPLRQALAGAGVEGVTVAVWWREPPRRGAGGEEEAAADEDEGGGAGAAGWRAAALAAVEPLARQFGNTIFVVAPQSLARLAAPALRAPPGSAGLLVQVVSARPPATGSEPPTVSEAEFAAPLSNAKLSQAIARAIARVCPPAGGGPVFCALARAHPRGPAPAP
jgi:hypothetical protein